MKCTCPHCSIKFVISGNAQALRPSCGYRVAPVGWLPSVHFFKGLTAFRHHPPTDGIAPCVGPFRLDNTLLADSDSWGEWLSPARLVDTEYRARNDGLYAADYVAGKLDVLAYQAFAGDPSVAPRWPS